jgi:ribose-phosphate pyrophosphokinase
MLKIFSGSSNPELTREICEYLQVEQGKLTLKRFSDGEIRFQILENVRGADVFVVQPSCPPVNESIMELLIMIDAFKRASARRITAVMPYYGYARQDRKDRPRVPISAKVLGDLLTAVGVNRLLTMDLHAGQIQGFFNIPVDHLFAAPVILDYFESVNLPNVTIVSPDAGGVERARFFAKQLKTDLAIIDKRRVDANEAEIMNIIGDIQGKDVVILDDMVDTAGTLVKAAQALRDQGAKKIFAAITHPILSGPAISRLESSVLEKLIVTNSIKIGPEKRIERLEILSVASLMGEAICSIHEETSVSRLFIS